MSSDHPTHGTTDDADDDPAAMDYEAHRAARSAIPTPSLGSVSAAGLDSLGRLLLGSESVASVLHRAASYAQRTMPMAEEASITLSSGARQATAAWTGLMAFELDECQYGLGYGPCLEAAATGHAVLIADTQADTRWADFAQLASRQGVRSILSVPIALTGDARAALNLYSTTAGAFDDPLVAARAAHTAGQTAAAIANMYDLETARTEIAHLELALASRAGIEQAKGILMAIHGYDPDTAFQALSTQSQQTNTKLRDIAAQIVAQVQRPHVPAAGDPSRT